MPLHFSNTETNCIMHWFVSQHSIALCYLKPSCSFSVTQTIPKMQLLIALILPLTCLSAIAAMECCPPTELFFKLNNPLTDTCSKFELAKHIHFWVKELCSVSVCEDLSAPTPCCAAGCDAACCNCQESCKVGKKSIVKSFKRKYPNDIRSVHVNQRKFQNYSIF